MKKMFIVLCLFCAGCSFLASVTPEQPLGSVDPNTAGAVVEIGEAVGAVGTLTGNPALVGAGILLATIASIYFAGKLRKK